MLVTIRSGFYNRAFRIWGFRFLGFRALGLTAGLGVVQDSEYKGQ